MPDKWFSYRNYFVEHRPGSPTAGNVGFADAFTQSFMGGYTWRFTGHLATAPFRAALGWDAVEQVEKTDQEMGPGLVTTRSQTAPPKTALPKTAKGKKAANKAPKKARRLQKVQARSRGVDSEDEEDEEEEEAAGVEKAATSASGSVANDEGEWEIDGLLEEKIKDGEISYLVDWSGNFEPS